MGSHTNPDLQPLLDDLRRIVQALRTTGTEARRTASMSGAQLFVLQQLAEKSPLSVNELAARVHAHQSSVSTMVARLSARGLVRRTPASKDRRRIDLSLTPRGRRILTSSPPTAQERLVLALEAMARRDRATLAHGLAELAGALGGPRRAIPPLFFEESGPPRRRRARP